jgi:hypothetical protein
MNNFTIEYINRITEFPPSRKMFETMWKSCKINIGNGKIANMSFRHLKQNTFNAKRYSLNKPFQIENGKYSFLIENHKEKNNPFVLQLGKYENPLELCVKHFDLKSTLPNTYVLVAGECEIIGNVMRYNLYSGTYTIPLLKSFPNIQNKVKNAMKEICVLIFSTYLKKQIEFTNAIIFDDYPINKSMIPQNAKNKSRVTLSKKYINTVRTQAPRGVKKIAEESARKDFHNYLNV